MAFPSERNFCYHEVLPRLNAHFEVEVFETLTQNDAVLLASKATDKNFDVILAAGGDGTVHQVLNGILRDRENRSNLPVLGVVPIGSGNDFARSLKLKLNRDGLLDLLKNGKPKKVDVGKITFRKSDTGEVATRYFLNEADIGMGPEVVQKVMASGRPFGSEISYYMAILSTFISFKPIAVKAITPTWQWEGSIRTLAIANGNYYGHGLCIAPDARPDDGKFATFICSGVSAFTFMRYSNDLKKGKHIRIPQISYNEAEVVDLTSAENCTIEADGEILGLLPARIEMLQKQILVLY